MLRRYDDRDVSAYGLLRRVAVHPLCGGVPTRDDAFERLTDDGVVGRLDDCGQEARALLALAQDLFGPPTLGDVVEDEDDAAYAPLLVVDGGAAVVNRRLRAVARDEHCVVRESDHLALAQDLLDRVLDLAARLLVDDVEDFGERARERVVERPAGQSF